MKALTATPIRPLFALLLGVAVSAACTNGTTGTGLGTGNGDGDGDGDADGDGGDAEVFSRAAMLENLADNVILPTYNDVKSKSEALRDATASWSTAMASDPSNATAEREAAQTAWREAMVAWQKAELMQFGPAAGAASGLQGFESLRDDIYSWPTESACGVDQQIVANEFGQDGWFDGRLVPLKGLDALEYLLFAEGGGNACPGSAQINQSGDWAALSADEVQTRRAGYANGAATYLVTSIDSLIGSWNGSSGYRARLLLEDDTFFATPAEAIDDVFAGVFYLELQTKDQKFAKPLGLHPDCTSDVCIDDLESGFAQHANQNIIANLEAFKMLLTGGDGFGFDDYLIDNNAGDLAADMATNTDAALTAMNNLGPLHEVLANDKPAAQSAYDALKLVTDDLKSQFVSVLNLRVPQEGAGDND